MRVHGVLEQVVPFVDDVERVVAMPPSRADEAMGRYADGDKAAFAVVYAELSSPLCGYARRRTNVDATAEDAAQQAFVHMMERADQFIRGAAVLPWAFAILRRILLDQARRDWHREFVWEGVLDLDLASSAPGAEQLMSDRELEHVAQRRLKGLRRSFRESFELVKLEGLSVAQAAEVLGITPGMVKIRTHRAKRALEEALAAESESHPRPRVRKTP
jgi:RNA polymerase sigma-70 factor (ECF subfamily)